MAATPNSPYTPLQKPVYVKPKHAPSRYRRGRKQGTPFYSPDPGYPKRGTYTGKTGVNATSNARKGQRYRVFKRNGTFFHVYGHGPNARWVRLRPQVAQAYGYTTAASPSGGTQAPNPY